MQAKTLLVSTALLVVACSGGGYDPEVSPGPATSARSQSIGWPIRTAEHFDLWMHGYAMIMNDTTKVPLFDRGYRERMLDRRRQLNVRTALDDNMQALRDSMARNPNVEGGQFAVFNFASFDELRRVVPQFIRNEGSPTTVNDQTTQQLFIALRNYFKTVGDREWLRMFMQALEDEQAKFYLSYWNAQQTDRASVRQAVESAWNNTYKAKFQRYLTNERITDGNLILSLPLGGEGRTVLSVQQGNAVATTFPDASGDQMAPIYVFAHEIVGNAAARAISDNLTPAQTREGVDQQLTPVGAVRGGALLLQRIAPELLQGYQRFYLRQAGAAVPSGDPAAAFVAAYDLPKAIAEGIARQIDLVLAGI